MFIKAFLFCGLVCFAGQLILDNTKLTPGHISCIFTVFGSFLSFLGIYDKLINEFGAGATVLISNFGHLLYTSAINGYNENGFLGLLQRMLCSSGTSIVSVLVLSFCFTLIFKAKD